VAATLPHDERRAPSVNAPPTSLHCRGSTLASPSDVYTGPTCSPTASSTAPQTTAPASRPTAKAGEKYCTCGVLKDICTWKRTNNGRASLDVIVALVWSGSRAVLYAGWRSPGGWFPAFLFDRESAPIRDRLRLHHLALNRARLDILISRTTSAASSPIVTALGGPNLYLPIHRAPGADTFRSDTPTYRRETKRATDATSG
jgi:hypothetical protein